MMTDQDKNKIRQQLAGVFIRTGEVKFQLKQIIGDFELPHSIIISDHNISDYKFEIDALNQVWNNIFNLWNSIEEAMIYESTTLEIMKNALDSGLPAILLDIDKIENSIEAKSS